MTPNDRFQPAESNQFCDRRRAVRVACADSRMHRALCGELVGAVMRLNTFGGVLAAFVLAFLVYGFFTYVAPCIDNYGRCPL